MLSAELKVQDPPLPGRLCWHGRVPCSSGSPTGSASCTTQTAAQWPRTRAGDLPGGCPPGEEGHLGRAPGQQGGRLLGGLPGLLALLQQLLSAALPHLERAGVADLAEALVGVEAQAQGLLCATAALDGVLRRGRKGLFSEALAGLRAGEAAANWAAARELLQVVQRCCGGLAEDLGGLLESHSGLQTHVENLVECTVLERDYWLMSAFDRGFAERRRAFEGPMDLVEALDAALLQLQAADALTKASFDLCQGLCDVQASLARLAQDSRRLGGMLLHGVRHSRFPREYGELCDSTEAFCRQSPAAAVHKPPDACGARAVSDILGYKSEAKRLWGA